MIGHNSRGHRVPDSAAPQPSPAVPAEQGSRDAPDASLSRLRTVVNELAAASRAPATRRSYAAAWSSFLTWTDAHSVTAVPASGEVVALYLAHLASNGRKSTTIARALVAITDAHRERGALSPRTDPLVAKVLRGIRRGERYAAPRAPIGPDELRVLLAVWDETLLGLRNRAVLALGFASGLRRSELAALDVADLAPTSRGLVVTVRRGKADQEGAGRRLEVIHGGDELCPVVAVTRWLERSGIAEGPLFRSVSRGGQLGRHAPNPRLVDRIVKAACVRAGLDPARFGAHSLRAGCATTAAARGQSTHDIARLLGHHTLAQAARYIRDARFPSLASGATT